MKRSRAVTALRLALMLAAAASLPGCAGVLVGGGAAVGTAAYSDRGVDGAARDMKIGTTIYTRFFDFSQDLAIKIGTEVYDGRVLLTGVAANEQMRADAVRIAWTVGGVKDVLNEIQLTGGSAGDLSRDSWITTQLKSKITFDKEIMAVNYSIETVNQTIYLIGLAQSRAEMDRVMAHARSIEYVKDVVSHVKIKGAS
ncbi:BON domain-containing protein [Shumkonia mesophila]|uniref:BON domain-containing protein n=1 Tax=Shumkonia mesophila TaxID=2838854 RepID=UPI00293480BB|nr:BON domain-containing protein [Shumkonia mesophila]